MKKYGSEQDEGIKVFKYVELLLQIQEQENEDMRK